LIGQDPTRCDILQKY